MHATGLDGVCCPKWLSRKSVDRSGRHSRSFRMPDDATTRWTVSVAKDTDIAVCSFLAQRGMKKGDLSKLS